MLGLIHNMVYNSMPIVNEYDTYLYIIFYGVLEHCSLDKIILCLVGKFPLLELCIENLDHTLSIYDVWDRAQSFFLQARMTCLPII